jgi:hypothetical protein
VWIFERADSVNVRVHTGPPTPTIIRMAKWPITAALDSLIYGDKICWLCDKRIRWRSQPVSDIRWCQAKTLLLTPWGRDSKGDVEVILS